MSGAAINYIVGGEQPALMEALRTDPVVRAFLDDATHDTRMT